MSAKDSRHHLPAFQDQFGLGAEEECTDVEQQVGYAALVERVCPENELGAQAVRATEAGVDQTREYREDATRIGAHHRRSPKRQLASARCFGLVQRLLQW